MALNRLIGFFRRRKLVSFLLAWALVGGATLAILVLSGSWTVHGFTSSGVGPTAIAVDSRGGVHIVYTDGHLEYTTNAGGSWTTQTLDSEHDVWQVALALDSQGGLHIAYEAWTRVNWTYTYGPAVEYLTNADGTWEHRTLDANGRAPSIAVDSTGSSYVAYSSYESGNATSNLGNESVRLATNAGGVWTNSTAWGWYASDGSPPYLTALAVDAHGAVHIVYSVVPFLRYMTNKTGAWTRQWLDAFVSSDQTPSLALDSSGRVHTAFLGTVYRNGSQILGPSLIHAAGAAGNWTYETAGAWSGLSCPCSSAMTLDSRGHVHVVYSDRGLNTLNYATNATGTWTASTIERGNIVGLYTAITADAQGRPHVSYADQGSITGGRYATTVVNPSNLADFLVGNLPALFLEFVVLLVTALVAPPILRRARNKRRHSPDLADRP